MEIEKRLNEVLDFGTTRYTEQREKFEHHARSVDTIISSLNIQSFSLNFEMNVSVVVPAEP